MTDAVSTERWLAAQKAEREFWQGVPSDAGAVGRDVASASELALWASSNLPQISRDASWVEFGIGPLGIGCAHFIQGDRQGEIVGVDPQELVAGSALALPDPLLACIRECRNGNYRHVVATGESTGLDPGRFELAVLNNMLDHVRDPAAVFSEVHRILQPGGFLIVGCDVFSLAGRLKFAHYTRRRMPESILVRAHPFRFSAAELKRMTTRAGFRILATSGGDSNRLAALIGHADRMYLLSQRSPA